MVNLNWQPGMTLESIEKEAILQAFRYFRGVKVATANALGMGVRTLEEKLKKYQEDTINQKRIEDERKRREDEFRARSRGQAPPFPQNPNQRPMETVHEGLGRNVQNGKGAEGRVHVQSTFESTEEHAVSMPVREEIQSVPPRKAASGDSKRHGR